jgi:hypothetical protein
VIFWRSTALRVFLRGRCTKDFPVTPLGLGAATGLGAEAVASWTVGSAEDSAVGAVAGSVEAA